MLSYLPGMKFLVTIFLVSHSLFSFWHIDHADVLTFLCNWYYSDMLSFILHPFVSMLHSKYFLLAQNWFFDKMIEEGTNPLTRMLKRWRTHTSQYEEWRVRHLNSFCMMTWSSLLWAYYTIHVTILIFYITTSAKNHYSVFTLLWPDKYD